MKSLLTILLSFVSVAVFAAQSAAVTLTQLQADALRVSPNLQSLTRQIEAAHAAAQQAGRWSNPELTISADKDEQDIAVRQIFDIWRKLPTARRLALTEADINAAKLASTRLALLNEVATHFWTLRAAIGRRALLEAELADWQRLLDIRKAELEAGEIATADLLTAQHLVAQRRRDRWAVVAAITASRVALNMMTGRTPDTPLEIDSSAEPMRSSSEATSASDAIDLALSRNPILTKVRTRLEGAGFRVRQEKRRWAPDPKLGPFVRNSRDETFLGLSVSFSLPVLDRNRDGIRAGTANLEAVQSDMHSAELTVAQEAFIAFELLAQARESYAEMTTIMTGPSARQRELAEESFKLGAISERDFVAAKIEWAQRQQDLAQLMAQIGIAEARLSRVLAANTVEDSSWTRTGYKN